jgi:signal transduction histidine kinase
VHEIGGTPAYLGADRRQRRAVVYPRLCATELVTFAGALVVIGLLVPTALSQLTAFDAAVHTQTTLRMTWSTLFVSAGVLRLVQWRITGQSRAGLLGCGLFCYGALSATMPALASLMVDDPLDVWLSPITRTVTASAFLVLLVRAFRTPAVDAGLRPMRTIVRTLAVGYAVVAPFIAANQTGHSMPVTATGWFVLGCALSVGWLGIATLALTRGARDGDVSAIWIGFGLTVLGASQLLHALAFVTSTDTAFYGTGLNLVVAGVALGNAGRDLGMSLAADGTALLELRGALVQSERLLDADERQHRQRLHDARSLIAALKMTSVALDRYDEKLESGVKHRLRSSLVSELDRLEDVIDGRRREPLQNFLLEDALGPLIAAHRHEGVTIRSSLGSTRALGRSLELATVVQNLIADARRHIPAAGSIRVYAQTSPHGVRVVVEDRRPGMGDRDPERYFDRDREHSAPGAGLGLFLARRLIREQCGDLTLQARAGGGARYVISLLAPPDDGTGEANTQVIVFGDAPPVTAPVTALLAVQEGTSP